MIKSVQFAIGLIVLGLILLVASFLWPFLLPPDVVWTEEQARENAAAAAALHQVTHEAAHVDLDGSESEKSAKTRQLNEAQTRFDNSRSALDRARRMRETTPIVLRWIGIVVGVVGVLRYKMIEHETPKKGRARR